MDGETLLTLARGQGNDALVEEIKRQIQEHNYNDEEKEAGEENINHGVTTDSAGGFEYQTNVV